MKECEQCGKKSVRTPFIWADQSIIYCHKKCLYVFLKRQKRKFNILPQIDIEYYKKY